MGLHQSVLTALQTVVGRGAVVCDRCELIAYECDGLPIAKGTPDAVVLPLDTRQVVQCVQVLAEHDIQMVPRGSGTGLAGGCVAFGGGVVVSTSRMTRIESIDLHNRVAVVQAGVRNQEFSDTVAALGTPFAPGDLTSPAFGLKGMNAAPADPSNDRIGHHVDPSGSRDPSPCLRFSPDPSSQAVATIGGNAATNAGGINTLKYGVTCRHILGAEFVLADGSVVITRPGGLRDGIGADLPSLLCGSEGTLGIITRLWCQLTPTPRHFRTVCGIYDFTLQACKTVSDIIAEGIVPTSMEMLDGAMIQVVEEAFGDDFGPSAQALLLIEIDGIEQVLDRQLEQVVRICRANRARDIQQCADPYRRDELWRVRKCAFGAIGRISRSYCTQDACIPRSKLAEAIDSISRIGRRYGIRISNVFHAGDGNVHPILLFDEDDPEDVQRVLSVSQEILQYCISIGGTITGEHGVGVEKLHLMAKMFNVDTMDVFDRIKRVFDPHRRVNDGKLVPSDRLQIQLKNRQTSGVSVSDPCSLI